MLHFFNIFSEGGQVPEVLGPPGRGEQNHHQCGPRRGGGALHLQAWRLLLPELLFFPKHFGVDLTGIHTKSIGNLYKNSSLKTFVNLKIP